MIDIRSMAQRFEPVGSRITCDPAPMDTDEDFLVLIEPGQYRFFDTLVLALGYEFGGSRIHAGGCILGDERSFQSYTLGTTNLIVTAGAVFFDRFMLATAQAKVLNLLDKADRIALFQSILYPS